MTWGFTINSVAYEVQIYSMPVSLALKTFHSLHMIKISTSTAGKSLSSDHLIFISISDRLRSSDLFTATTLLPEQANPSRSIKRMVFSILLFFFG